VLATAVPKALYYFLFFFVCNEVFDSVSDRLRTKSLLNAESQNDKNILIPQLNCLALLKVLNVVYVALNLKLLHTVLNMCRTLGSPD
jgi:hypothetical protein